MYIIKWIDSDGRHNGVPQVAMSEDYQTVHDICTMLEAFNRLKKESSKNTRTITVMDDNGTYYDGKQQTPTFVREAKERFIIV